MHRPKDDIEITGKDIILTECYHWSQSPSPFWMGGGEGGGDWTYLRNFIFLPHLTFLFSYMFIYSGVETVSRSENCPPPLSVLQSSLTCYILMYKVCVQVGRWKDAIFGIYSCNERPAEILEDTRPGKTKASSNVLQ
jgi:hypothetical protein